MSIMSDSVRPHRQQPTRLPSLGFSRQEYWSGLPFPSPVRESEKWKWSRSVVSDSSQPHGLQPTRLLSPWDFPGNSTGVGCHCLLRICVTHEFVSAGPPHVEPLYKAPRQQQPQSHGTGSGWVGALRLWGEMGKTFICTWANLKKLKNLIWLLAELLGQIQYLTKISTVFLKGTQLNT